jgi:LysR family cyn operon transcriptional activator
MELRHLRYLLALSEHRSFTRAAQVVHVTQSTLSHQIRQLELELGVDLFDRSGRQVILTAAGETLVPGVRRAFDELNAAIRDLKQSRSGELEEVRCLVGARGAARRIFGNALGDHSDSWGKIKLKIKEVYAVELQDILGADGAHDVVVGDLQNLPPDWSFEALYMEEIGLLVPPSHPLAGRRRVRLAELHGECLVMLSPPEPTRIIIDECLQKAGVKPRIMAELNKVDASFEMAMSSGFAVLSSRNLIPNNELIYVPLEDPAPYRMIGLMWPPGAGAAPLMRSIVGRLRRVVKDLASAKDPTFVIQPYEPGHSLSFAEPLQWNGQSNSSAANRHRSDDKREVPSFA